MTLPPKALTVLVDLKRELLATSTYAEQRREYDGLPVELGKQGLRAEPEHHTPERTMRHARWRSGGFQRMCRQAHW